MTFLKLKRSYLTMSELAGRWKLESDLDLRRLVMEQILRPCVMLEEELQPVDLHDGGAIVRSDERVPVRGWLYPQYPVQFLPFDCRYQFVSDMAQPVTGCTLYGLPEPMTLTYLMGCGVAMLEDVEAVEAQLGRDPDRHLTARQERSRDMLITVLAVEHLGWEPWRDGADLKLGDLLEASQVYGLSISRNTAKEHLRLAWERVKPSLETQGKARVSVDTATPNAGHAALVGAPMLSTESRTHTKEAEMIHETATTAGVT